MENPIEKCIRQYLYGEELIWHKYEEGYQTYDNRKKCRELKNCDYYSQNGECVGCETGYALSSDKKSCKQFENCEQLEEGDSKCNVCVEYFHPNAEDKCEKTLCEKFASNNVSSNCYGGYYSDNNECKKITIENCLKLDTNDKTKCSECLGNITPTDGKWILPSTLIEGCLEYGENGECTGCEEDYGPTDDGKSCKFKGCWAGSCKVEYCGICKASYEVGYDEEVDGPLCIGYDGSRDTSSQKDSSSGNKPICFANIFISNSNLEIIMILNELNFIKNLYFF